MKTTVPPNTASATNQSVPASTTVNKAAQGAREIVDKVASMADDAVRKAIPAAQQFAHRAVDKAEASAVPAAEWLEEHADQLKNAQDELLDSTRNYIRENPLTSIGVAFAAGILLSRIVR